MQSLRPRSLQQGDTIAILAPATTIKSEYVAGAGSFLQALGYRIRIMRHTLGPADGTYASSKAFRLTDFIDAYTDPEVRAILCARGGYGTIHLIDHITPELLKSDPKWVIGFSDISAFHAMMHRAGICSLHASMAKHLTLLGRDECTENLLQILTKGTEIKYDTDGDSRNIEGKATGKLRGGNLAVLDGLVGTPYDILTPSEGEDVILFIEDIGEAIYRTERMIRRLSLSGALQRYKGIIVGQFTESHPDLNFETTADMLRKRLPEWGVSNETPIAFNFPIGHTDRNLPIIEGCQATLNVSKEHVTLIMH